MEGGTAASESMSHVKGIALLLKEVYHIHVHTIRGLEGSLVDLQTKYDKLMKLKDRIFTRGKQLQKSYDALLVEVHSLKGAPPTTDKYEPDTLDLGSVDASQPADGASSRLSLRLVRDLKRTRYIEGKAAVAGSGVPPLQCPVAPDPLAVRPLPSPLDLPTPAPAQRDLSDGGPAEYFVPDTCVADLDGTVLPPADGSPSQPTQMARSNGAVDCRALRSGTLGAADVVTPARGAGQGDDRSKAVAGELTGAGRRLAAPPSGSSAAGRLDLSVRLSPPRHTSTPAPPGGARRVSRVSSPSLFDEESDDDRPRGRRPSSAVGGRLAAGSPAGGARSPPRSRRRLVQTTLSQCGGARRPRVSTDRDRAGSTDRDRAGESSRDRAGEGSTSRCFKMPPLPPDVLADRQATPPPPDPNGSIAADVRLSAYLSPPGGSSVRRLDEDEDEDEASEPLLTQWKAADASVASVVFGAKRRRPGSDDGREGGGEEGGTEKGGAGPGERRQDAAEHSFDRRPKAATPGYAYVDVVRKHAQRRQLEAFACNECAEYFSSLGLSEAELRERMKGCRHRARHEPPSTPEHFWSVGFPDTQQCEERGYLQTTQAKPSRFRRRHRLEKLFTGANEDVASQPPP